MVKRLELQEVADYLKGLSQDELYALLTECGLRGLTKLNGDEEGRIILEEVEDDNN